MSCAARSRCAPVRSEEILEHWEGYRGSHPVRIGNGASDQLQLDIYGELLDSVYEADRHGLRVGHRGWQALSDVLDWLGENWDRPEEGIWETRGGRENFTYGRLMNWVAFDRGARLAESLRRPGQVEEWRAHRDRIYVQIWAQGWHPGRQAYLVVDSLVYRYDPAASPDGLLGPEGTFSLCSFNYVNALIDAAIALDRSLAS